MINRVNVTCRRVLYFVFVIADAACVYIVLVRLCCRLHMANLRRTLHYSADIINRISIYDGSLHYKANTCLHSADISLDEYNIIHTNRIHQLFITTV